MVIVQLFDLGTEKIDDINGVNPISLPEGAAGRPSPVPGKGRDGETELS
jgi:hypothetical protein